MRMARYLDPEFRGHGRGRPVGSRRDLRFEPLGTACHRRIDGRGGTLPYRCLGRTLYRCLGRTLYRSHESERPMTVLWEL